MARRPTRLFRDYGSTILAAVVVALLIRFFVIEAYRIPSAAMKPTLEAGDTIFVGKLAYGLFAPRALPERGDVVVFTPALETRRDFIKRVIGVPGDTVEVRKGRVKLNGRALEIDKVTTSPCGREQLPGGKSFEYCLELPLIEDFGPEKVPEGQLFLLGDFRGQNPNDRTDVPDPYRVSPPKSWGIFPASTVKGKALWIWLSVERGSGGWFPQLRLNRMLKRVD